MNDGSTFPLAWRETVSALCYHELEGPEVVICTPKPEGGLLYCALKLGKRPCFFFRHCELARNLPNNFKINLFSFLHSDLVGLLQLPLMMTANRTQAALSLTGDNRQMLRMSFT